MASYLTLFLYLLGAEVTRRIFVAVVNAYTGPLAKIPGPFLAKFTHFAWLTVFLREKGAEYGDAWVQKYGPVVRIAPDLVIFSEKATIRKILSELDLKKAPVYDDMRLQPEVASLFTETDKVSYKNVRRLMSGAFSNSYLNGLESPIQECVEEFERFLDSECAKAGDGPAVVDVWLVLSNLAFDIMSAIAFGGSMHMTTTNDHVTKESISKFFGVQSINSALPWLKYVPFGPKGQTPALIKMTEDIIAKRRAATDRGEHVKKDILQSILDGNSSDPVAFPEARIRSEMNTFMAAGTDTSSYTLTCALLLLLNNPLTLQKLIAELENSFPQKDDPITFAATQDLPYLNGVINEAMRLMPAVNTGLTRITSETTILSGYVIPPNTEVACWLQVPLQDEAYWPDGSQFVPERWISPYKGVEADRSAFIPFSLGTRNCIGQELAKKEMRHILATLVRRYELSLVPGQSHELGWKIVPTFRQGFYNVGIKTRA